MALLKGNAIRFCSPSSFVFIIVFLSGGLGMGLPVIIYDETLGRTTTGKALFFLF